MDDGGFIRSFIPMHRAVTSTTIMCTDASVLVLIQLDQYLH